MNLTNSEISEIKIWSYFNKKIIKFENTANSEIFKQLFCDDWERLLSHFIYNCDRNFNKFKSYLTIEQSNLLIVYIVRLTL